jgi:hypothetical protein
MLTDFCDAAAMSKFFFRKGAKAQSLPGSEELSLRFSFAPLRLCGSNSFYQLATQIDVESAATTTTLTREERLQ